MNKDKTEQIREEFDKMLVDYLEMMNFKTAMFYNRPYLERDTYPEFERFHKFISQKLEEQKQEIIEKIKNLPEAIIRPTEEVKRLREDEVLEIIKK